MIGSIVTLENLYLNVPFEAKDAAKDAGAKWDAASKLWYAPPGLDPLGFRNWWSFLRPAFADKDRIKAMGGKFHPVIKAWYVPAKFDYDEFREWWPKDCLKYLFNDRFAAYSRMTGGGQSSVFRGYDLTNNAECAIKLYNLADEDDGVTNEGFEREHDALLQLHHPNILPILDWGRHDLTGQYFLVSPWIPWTLNDWFDDKEEVYRALYQPFLEAYPENQEVLSEDDFVSAVMNDDDDDDDDWLELCDEGYVGDVLKGLIYAADKSIIHRDVKPANIFVGYSFNPDVLARGLDDEHDIEQRREALIEAGKENGYVTYEDIAYAQGDDEEFDTALDFYSDLILRNIEVRDRLTDKTLIGDFGASKNWSLEGKKNATMVHLRTEPWTPPRTDSELFFERTWDGYAWGVLAIACMCEEIPETRGDIDRLLDGKFKAMVGDNLWDFVSRIVHVDPDRRPPDIKTLDDELAKLNDIRREAIGA